MSYLQQKLKEKIDEVGHSVQALEKQAGLKPSAIQNIIAGKSRNPKITTLHAIAQILDCSVEDFVPKAALSTYGQENPISALWEGRLYVQCLEAVVSFAKKTNVTLTKDQAFRYAEEAYEYSLKSKKKKPDKAFIQWIISKASKPKFLK